MAVGVLMMLPGSNAEQYEQVTEKIFGSYPPRPEDSPDGLVVHSAGPAEGGWYIYDIWESKEDFERFSQERIAPAAQAVVGDLAAQAQPQFFEIHALMRQ